MSKAAIPQKLNIQEFTPQLVELNHPLIEHKLSIIRDKNTKTKEFRECVKEIALLMSYEVFKSLPTVETTVETVFGETVVKKLPNKALAIVPILRAGLGFSDALLEIIPTAKTGHVGAYRDEKTLQPKSYYCRFPLDIKDRTVILCDPMLATGGSMVYAISKLKEAGVKKIIAMTLISAPVGLEKIKSTYPDVLVYTAKVDKCLNANGYILPGCGDCGDRIFGTDLKDY